MKLRTPLSSVLAGAALAAVLAGAAAPLLAQGLGDVEEKAAVELRADRTAYEPGATVRVAAQVEIEHHWHVNSHTPTYDWLIPTELTLELPEGAGEPRLTYPPHELQQFAFTEEPIAVYDGEVTIFAEFELPQGVEPGVVAVAGALRYQACDDSQCLPPVTTLAALELTVGPGGEPADPKVFAPPGEGSGGAAGVDAAAGGGATTGGAGGTAPSLLLMLALAFVGGLILNAMPCVLPVLSLKVFGLVKSAGQGRSHLLFGALATTGGILASFWVLAGAAVAAASAGAAVGWGVQFQQPGFVAFLAVVVVLFSLNMWGVFEITLPTGLAQVAGGAQREGLSGHFTSGLFATLMATPCSAPFLGTAVGFALAQSPAVIFATFTAVGIGLASPYLLLAAVPATVRYLPKPGPWMVTFRQAMGFLLAASAIWLFYVLAAQVSAERLAYVQLAILALALFAWWRGRAVHRPAPRRVAAAGMLVAAVGGIVLAHAAAPSESAGRESAGLIDWVAFDEQEASRLAAEGRLVFVDVTADWCLTCKTTERLVLETTEVAAAFDRHQVVPMKADWTNRNDAITDFLASYGKAAVPFYVLYRPGQDPYPFGELLTRQRLLDALAEASTVAAAAGVADGAGRR